MAKMTPEKMASELRILRRHVSTLRTQMRSLAPVFEALSSKPDE